MKIIGIVSSFDLKITKKVNAEGDAKEVHSVENAQLESIKLTSLTGNEQICIESQKPFEEGESLMVMVPAIFKNKSVEFGDVLYVIKNASLEDFTARMIKNSEAP